MLIELAAVGCDGPPSVYQVHIDPALSNDQTHAVLLALEEWQRAPVRFAPISMSADECGGDGLETVGCIHIGFTDEAALRAMCHTSQPEDGCESMSFHVFHSLGGRVMVWTGDGALTHAALLHEIGHALGLSHEPATAMDPQIPRSPGHLTCNDIGQYYGVHGTVFPGCSTLTH